MGTDPKAALRGLVAAAVLVGAGTGIPVRAEGRLPAPRTRLAVVAVELSPRPAAAGPAAGGGMMSGEVRLPFPATHVGVRWRGGEDTPVEIRWWRSGAWGDWRGLSIWEDAGDEDPRNEGPGDEDAGNEDAGNEDAGIVAAGLVRPEPGATRLAVRSSGAVTEVEAVVIDAGRSPPALSLPGATGGGLGPGGAADSGRGAAAPAGVRVALRPTPAANPSPSPQPDIVSRAGWGADEGMRTGKAEFAPISKLIVHHTVTRNDDPDPAQTVRAIYAYHTRRNGWNDIGYNFLVDQQGRVYEGRFARRYRPGEAPTGEDARGRGVIGAHAKGLNPGTVGVAVLGDYSGGAVPSGPALDRLVGVLAWKAGRHHIDPHGAAPHRATNGSRRTFPNIAGHRDIGRTGCPGGRLYERLPEIRRRVAEALGAAPAPPPPPRPLPPAPRPVPEFPGFWAAGADGRISAFGDVRSAGDLAGRALSGPIVSLAAAPAGRGYWMVGSDGGVFAFGDAPYLGAATGRLRSPAVHLEPTPSGKGYWVLSAAGEVVPFGDAPFLGQLYPLPASAVGLASTPNGQGYWVATTDARVFSFGDAALGAVAGGSVVPAGVTGGGTTSRPAGPTVAIAASPNGRGYWLLGSDGGVFSFGVPFHGSVVDRQPYAKAVALQASDAGEGYYVAGTDGAVFAFGDADRRRERPADGADALVDVAFRPITPRPAPAPPAPPAEPAPPGPPVEPAPPAPPAEPAPPGPPGAPATRTR